ncbi:MAG: dethiobiotin synthase [Candidatus Binatia bacterium]|nr:dethiobiotin synthase [Candidatus Binatia bacterium]
MSTRIVFVTGTDTGVGKTTVSCGLVAALHARGLRVGVFKPAETGCSTGTDGKLVPADAVRLRGFAGAVQPLEEVCPYVFAEPLAPAIAAQREGRSIDFRWLCQHITSHAGSYDLALVEGAGGWLVPLTEQLTFADLALALGAHALVVVANRLGALNHALLTVQNIRMHGARWLGYVWNHPIPVTEVAQRTNVDALRAWLGEPLGAVPYSENALLDPQEAAQVTETSIDVDRLLATISGLATK